MEATDGGRRDFTYGAPAEQLLPRDVVNEELPLRFVSLDINLDNIKQSLDVDLHAFLFEENGRYVDCVFYKNPTLAGKSVRLFDKRILFDLKFIPQRCNFIVCTLAVYSGGSLLDLRSGEVELSAVVPRQGQERGPLLDLPCGSLPTDSNYYDRITLGVMPLDAKSSVEDSGLLLCMLTYSDGFWYFKPLLLPVTAFTPQGLIEPAQHFVVHHGKLVNPAEDGLRMDFLLDAAQKDERVNLRDFLVSESGRRELKSTAPSLPSGTSGRGDYEDAEDEQGLKSRPRGLNRQPSDDVVAPDFGRVKELPDVSLDKVTRIRHDFEFLEGVGQGLERLSRRLGALEMVVGHGGDAWKRHIEKRLGNLEEKVDLLANALTQVTHTLTEHTEKTKKCVQDLKGKYDKFKVDAANNLEAAVCGPLDSIERRVKVVISNEAASASLLEEVREMLLSLDRRVGLGDRRAQLIEQALSELRFQICGQEERLLQATVNKQHRSSTDIEQLQREYSADTQMLTTELNVEPKAMVDMGPGRNRRLSVSSTALDHISRLENQAASVGDIIRKLASCTAPDGKKGLTDIERKVLSFAGTPKMFSVLHTLEQAVDTVRVQCTPAANTKLY